jgi:hypothetical protein
VIGETLDVPPPTWLGAPMTNPDGYVAAVTWTLR